MSIIRIFILIVVCFLLSPETSNTKRSFRFSSKAKGFFHTRTETILEGNTVKLKFSVTATQDIENAVINWTIPKDSNILSGANQVRANFKKSNPQTFEIIVDKMNLEPVRAEVFTIQNQFKFGAVGSFIHRPAKIRALNYRPVRLQE